MTPKEMCSGACNGRRNTCPTPMACGLPDDTDVENKILRQLVGILACVGLIFFCAGVIVWL